MGRRRSRKIQDRERYKTVLEDERKRKRGSAARNCKKGTRNKNGSRAEQFPFAIDKLDNKKGKSVNREKHVPSNIGREKKRDRKGENEQDRRLGRVGSVQE